MKFLAFLFLTTATAFAGSFDAYLDNLGREYLINKSTRGRELANKVSVKKFGGLGGVFNRDAIATYNPTFKTINLAEELLIGNTIRGDIQDASKVSTIFHEMGHAEMDIYILAKKDASDLPLFDHYNGVMKDFNKRSFPSFNSLTVFHEHFGYYRAELIMFFWNEFQNVLMTNGYNMYANRCFFTHLLKKKLAEGISLEEFKKFMVSETDKGNYSTLIHPGFVFIKGKEIDLKAPGVDQNVINRTHQLFFAYHQNHYDFPVNETELIKRMNLRGKFKAAVAECREKMWNNPQAFEEADF